MPTDEGNGSDGANHTWQTAPDPPDRGAWAEVFQVGQQVHGCVIEAKIAEGGQGIVYRAHQLNPDRTVAIKALRSGSARSRRIERFMAECKNLANSPHPNIIALHDVGTATDAAGHEVPFLIMEYIPDARPLTEAARHFRWDTRTRIEKFIDASQAVERLHKHGVRHFDLKPANILVDSNEWVRVSDFGLARSYAERIDASSGGTLSHMSPEQCRGDAEALDARSDVYSMGVVLYELLSGERPIDLSRFDKGSMRLDAAFDLICNDPPTPLRSVAPEIDPGLEAIVMRALEKTPTRRFEDMRDFRRALEGWLDGHTEPTGADHLLRRVVIPIAVCLAVTVGGAFVAAKWVGPWLAARSGFLAWYENVLSSSLEPIPPDSDLLHSAVIAFRDSTDAAALAAERGVEGVTNESVGTHRALHGELCRRLAKSGARAVVFDIIFRREASYDEALSGGFRALRDAGVPVVIAAPAWDVDKSTGRPELSEALCEAADWGCLEVQIGLGDALWIPLAVQSEGGEITPSLSLAAYAAAGDEGGRHEFEFRTGRSVIDIVHWAAREPGGRRKAGMRTSVPVASIEPFVADPRRKTYGKLPTDKEARYRPVLFDLGPLERVTHDYQDVMEADEVQLRTWFAGRTVFIGNFTSRAGDVHSFRGGAWGGVYFHVLSFESLSRGVYPRAATLPIDFWAAFPAAMLGFVGLGAGTKRRWWARTGVGLLIVAGIGCAALAAGLIAYREGQFLFNPVTPMVAALVACVAAAVWCVLRPHLFGSLFGSLKGVM